MRLHFKNLLNWVWIHTPILSAIWRLRQAELVCTTGSKLIWNICWSLVYQIPKDSETQQLKGKIKTENMDSLLGKTLISKIMCHRSHIYEDDMEYNNVFQGESSMAFRSTIELFLWLLTYSLVIVMWICYYAKTTACICNLFLIWIDSNIE